MQGRNRITEIALLLLGLILGCCWLPRGIQGLMHLARVVRPSLRFPDLIWEFLQLWSDPFSWYSRGAFQTLLSRSPRVSILLLAVPNCLCGIVAIVIIGLVVFLFVRTTRATGGGEPTS